MSLVEDARRLANNGQPPSYESEIDGIRTCRNCNAPVTQHAINCPWLAMPRIVAALEAAERLVGAQYAGEPVEEYGSERLYVFCRGDALSDIHTPSCRYQALVAAMRGEEVTA